MNSIINLVCSFIIFIMRHWNSQAAMIWGTDANTHNLDRESGDHPSLNHPYTWLKRQPAVTKIDNEFQSQPCLFFYHTHNRTLEQSSCCDLGVQMQTLTIWIWKVGTPSLNYPHTWLKSQPAVTKIDYEFQSQPCFFFYHTHNETFEQSSCYDMDVQMQTLTILIWKVGTPSLNYPHT